MVIQITPIDNSQEQAGNIPSEEKNTQMFKSGRPKITLCPIDYVLTRTLQRTSLFHKRFQNFPHSRWEWKSEKFITKECSPFKSVNVLPALELTSSWILYITTQCKFQNWIIQRQKILTSNVTKYELPVHYLKMTFWNKFMTKWFIYFELSHLHWQNNLIHTVTFLHSRALLERARNDISQE